MKADISRVTFDPLKHFTGVVMQQGRVQLDADWNEQGSILLHHLRTLAADLIGQHGGPGDIADPAGKLVGRRAGFAIIGANKGASGGGPTYLPLNAVTKDEEPALAKLLTEQQFPLLITKGHYYVDGLLSENENYWRYFEQPYLAQASDEVLKKLAAGIYLLFLDVWERAIIEVDDPSIREVALGGADTAARSKLIWQVTLWPEPLGTAPDCQTFEFPTKLKAIVSANRGTLRAKARQYEPGDAADPCTISPESRFRGIENPLYRVEIHRGSPPPDIEPHRPATFKWSGDNGMIVAPLKKKIGDKLIVSGLRDLSRWFTAGNWVEITHDRLELTGQPGTMVRLRDVDGETLTIDPKSATDTIYEPGKTSNGLPATNVKVRRWDQKSEGDDPLQAGAIAIKEKVWIELEDGVAVWFDFPSQGRDAAQYRTGDYWLIPARVATGDVEWPSESVPDPDDPGKTITQPAALTPRGIEHHYAPLAAITVNNAPIDARVTGVIDLRHRFGPLGVCS